MLRRLAAHLAPAGAAADGADDDDAEVAVGAVPGVAHYTDPASGARTLIRTLVANDVTVCFSNPGTSEMHSEPAPAGGSIALDCYASCKAFNWGFCDTT